MRGNKIIGCLLAGMILWGSVISAADVSASRGLVVRSPLYGDAPLVESVAPQEVLPLFKQLGLPEADSRIVDMDNIVVQRQLAAIGDATYPITPGDVFRLSYANGANRVVVDIQVDSTYQLDIPAIGTIDCAALTFPALKEKVFSSISTMYAHANPQFTLLSTGSFTVTIVGEVDAKTELSSWGLSRLSSTVYHATKYASSREVKVTSLDGTERTYDLFMALRGGKPGADPYLKSGDVVTYVPAEKIVTIGGLVKRPGTYQLREGETLSSLLGLYAGGVLPDGDIQHIRIRRFNPAEHDYDLLSVDCLQEQDLALQQLDAVMVDQVVPSAKSLTVQGAVKVDESVDPSSSATLLGQSSGKIFYQYYPGETLGQMVRALDNRFMITSDLSHAYLVRGGVRVPLDLADILSGKASGDDLVMQADDVVTIPFEQKFVTVSGAVARSGVYAYVPDKTADYYLAIAGGPTSDAKKPEKITIRDKQGEKLDRFGIIPAESTIDVKAKTFVNDLAPAVAVVGIVASVVGIVYNMFLINHYYQTDK